VQSQKISLLQLQIIELQKFIFGGKQEKFKPATGVHQLQTALFATNKLGEAVVVSCKQVKAYEVKQTALRVNHPGRKPLPVHLRREEIILLPTEDITGLQPVCQEVTEILEYQPGKLYVKKIYAPSI
jgi:transposase